MDKEINTDLQNTTHKRCELLPNTVPIVTTPCLACIWLA